MKIPFRKVFLWVVSGILEILTAIICALAIMDFVSRPNSFWMVLACVLVIFIFAYLTIRIQEINN